MRRPLYDTAAPRRTTSLTLNGDLLAKAKGEGINLSAVAERAIAAELAERTRERLREELRRGAEAYEAYIAEHGSFAEHLREYLDAEERAEAS